MHVPQDEREVKRQRRKQSNRESARRSRLRKQAECEALAVRVNELMNENVKLRAANEQLLKLQQLTSHQVSRKTQNYCLFVAQLAMLVNDCGVCNICRPVRSASRESALQLLCFTIEELFSPYTQLVDQVY